MKEYIKIETPFNRDVNGTKKLIEGDWRNETLEYLKDNKFICTEKVDGCLRSTTKLQLVSGKTMTIREIVDGKKEVEVLGYKDGKVVPSKVIDWHMNGITDIWYYIRYSRRGIGTKGGNTFRSIRCTGNHKFYVNGEYIKASELKVGDKVLLIRENQNLSWLQEQIITGLLIGDGSIGISDRCIEFSQLSKNEGYIDWLLNTMGNIAGKKHSIRISGYGSEILPARTISCNGIYDFVQPFQKDGKKIIPKDIEVSPISMAIMYMDDGSLQHVDTQEDRCILALNDYDEESVDNLVNAIKEQLHIVAVKTYSKGLFLRFNAREAEKLQLLIAPYICDCMQYKLSEKFRGKYAVLNYKEVYQTINTPCEMEILEIKKEIGWHKRYDITTETHNYFANGVLVHNCNISIAWDGHKIEYHGRTERAQIPANLMNKLIELFGGETNEQLFEQKFGEMPVILYGEGYGAKIQNGGLYRDDVSFILFDVYLPDDNIWLKRESVEDIAKAFNIDVVPVILTGTLQEAISFVKTKPTSRVGKCQAPMEGLVCRPAVELYDRMGKRVIVKVKVRDFT